MVSRRVAAIVLAWLAVLVFLPDRLEAQSAIAGVVKDTTGAVLPGVTVEASSPALIERVKTVTTDAAGLYRIIDLRPGSYVVTFTLPGFNVVRRDGIDLPSDFTATVNTEMKVGAVEETVTVTGASPVVDIKSATQGQVLSRELLDAVPTGRSIWALGSTLTGVTLSAPDVGGTAGMQQTYMAVHGSQRQDNAIQVDGMSVNGIEGDGAIQNYFNEGMFQEMSYQTSALSADVQSSGVRLNMIPKEGGNDFKGSLFLSRTPGQWQSNNFTDALRATGLQAPNRVEKIQDFNPGFGGPIKRNRLWFFSSFRRWGVDQTVTDSFYNLDPTHKTYIIANGLNGNPLKPTVDDNIIKSGVVRLTWQVSPKQKLSVYGDRIVKFRGHECPALYAEEACGIRSPKRYLMAQAKYTATLSSKLLIEAGYSENDETYSTSEAQPSVGGTDIPRFDRTTTYAWSAPQGPYYFREPTRYTYSGALSYVTGSHAVKAGMQWGTGGNHHQRSLQNGVDLIQEYRNLSPVSTVVYNTSMEAFEKIRYDLGFFVQDSWTFNRLTINPGLRMEFFNTYIPLETAPAGRFVPSRSYGPINDFPNWKDPFVPRIGGVYDVTGDGKTAVKAHAGKYMTAFSTVGFAQLYNPLRQESDRRNWTDTNKDDIAQNSEIGAVQTPFNTGTQLNRVPDPNIERPYQWEYSAGIQREIVQGVSVSANWVRRSWRRLIWTDNTLVDFNLENPALSDYTTVQTPNPLNPSESITIYNLKSTKVGQVYQVDKNSDQNQKWYNGYDIGFTARVRGANIYGGVSTGRMLTVNCQVDNPNSLRYCDQSNIGIPYLTQFKISGSYPLPYGIQISGNWQGLPGTGISTARQDSNYNATNNRVDDSSLNVNYVVDRTIIPSLVQSSVTVPLLKPGTKYLDRTNQVDVRLAKKFKVRQVKFQGQLDIFNVLNASSILTTVETFGSSLDRPSSILQGRLLAIGMQLTF